MAALARLPAHVVLGGYTAETEGTGTGLRSLVPDPTGRALAEVALEPLTSPSYVVAHPNEPWLLSLGESAPAELVTLQLHPDGTLTVLDRLRTGGDHGCHLAVSEDGHFVAVAHYSSGTVETFGLNGHGGLAGPLGRFAFDAPVGPDPVRQDRPHAHQVVFDGDELLAVDLGTDRVWRLQVAGDGSLSEAAPPLVLPPGSGPRHLVVLGEVLVVACELSVELWLGRRTADGWAHTASVPTTSRSGATSPVLPSAIRYRDDRLYVATRGVDTVSVFAVDHEAGTATPVVEFDCGGEHPRDLVLHGDHAWVANLRSDRVSVFDVTSLPPAGPAYTVEAPRPACVLLLDPPAGQRDAGGVSGR